MLQHNSLRGLKPEMLKFSEAVTLNIIVLYFAFNRWNFPVLHLKFSRGIVMFLLLCNNGIFLFVIKDIFCMSNDKKFFALRPNYFGLRHVLRDFLAWERPLGLSKAKKSRKTGRRPKEFGQSAKQLFCHCKWKIWSLLRVKCTFFIFGTSFLSEKDNFQAIKKFPWYKKS